MNIHIRAYDPMDMGQILRLYDSVHWTNYTDRPSMLASAIQHSLKTLVACFEDKILGIIRVVGDGYSVLYIQDLIVLPEYQRQGIGRLLVGEIDLLYPKVYQKVLLTDNQPASVCFYESCGFSLSGNFNCAAFVKFSF